MLNATELTDRLHARGIVPLPAEVWNALASEFQEIERHATGIAGDLLIIRTTAGPAAVEQPSVTERVVRVLKDDGEVRRFVRERMAQYERMWDGCGCKVDYHT